MTVRTAQSIPASVPHTQKAVGRDPHGLISLRWSPQPEETILNPRKNRADAIPDALTWGPRDAAAGNHETVRLFRDDSSHCDTSQPADAAAISGWLQSGLVNEGKLNNSYSLLFLGVWREVDLCPAEQSPRRTLACYVTFHSSQFDVPSYSSQVFEMATNTSSPGKRLFPYQLQGIRWMQKQEANPLFKGGILADEMGLGKTAQIVGLISADRGGCTLVVTHVSIVEHWRRELSHFPEQKMSVFCFLAGDDRLRVPRGIDVVLTTYSMMTRHDFACLSLRRIVLDEGHRIRNSRTGIFRCLTALEAEYRWVVTGTPVMNKLGDLYSIVRFLRVKPLAHTICLHCADCAKLVSESHAPECVDCGCSQGRHISFFQRFIADPLTRKVQPYELSAAYEFLAQITASLILRRRREDVIDFSLPALTEVVVDVRLEPEEQRLHDLLRDGAIGFVGTKPGGALLGILLIRRMLCDTQMLLDGIHYTNAIRTPAYQEVLVDLARRYPNGFARSSKLSALLRALSGIGESDKVIIFSQFTDFLDKIWDIVESTMTHCHLSMLTGDTSRVQRQKVIDGFNEGPGPRIILIALQAGGEGLNLQTANHVYLMEPWWNPAVEDQAVSRAMRLGNISGVTVTRFIVADTIEVRMRELQDKKRRLVHAILQAGDERVGDELLPHNDIAFLFGL